VIELIEVAATVLRVYNDIKAIAVAQGMDPDAFDKSADEECKRLPAWKAKTDADEDATFGTPK